MKYVIQTWVLGKFPEIEIDESKYLDIKAAKETLLACLSIEEKYELLLSNHLELEKEALGVTADYMVRNTADYSGFFDIRLSFNRRIVNLLTSTKLYIDQLLQHVKACIPEDLKLGDEVKSYFSEEYDSCFEYRLMEALRNYVQHRGVAVHSTTHGGRWTSLKSDGQLEFSLKLFTHKSELEGDKAFKTQVFNEMPDEVELMFSVRTYVGAISRVHEKIRDLLDKRSKIARAIISEVIAEYEALNSGNSIGLTAVCKKPKETNDEIVEKIPISLSWDNVRLKLIKKNKGIGNLGKRYVSGNAYNQSLEQDFQD